MFKSLFKNKKEEEMIKLLKSIDDSLKKLTCCIKKNERNFGDLTSLSIAHWND